MPGYQPRFFAMTSPINFHIDDSALEFFSKLRNKFYAADSTYRSSVVIGRCGNLSYHKPVSETQSVAGIPKIRLRTFVVKILGFSAYIILDLRDLPAPVYDPEATLQQDPVVLYLTVNVPKSALFRDSVVESVSGESFNCPELISPLVLSSLPLSFQVEEGSLPENKSEYFKVEEGSLPDTYKFSFVMGAVVGSDLYYDLLPVNEGYAIDGFFQNPPYRKDAYGKCSLFDISSYTSNIRYKGTYPRFSQAYRPVHRIIMKWSREPYFIERWVEDSFGNAFLQERDTDSFSESIPFTEWVPPTTFPEFWGARLQYNSEEGSGEFTLTASPSEEEPSEEEPSVWSKDGIFTFVDGVIGTVNPVTRTSFFFALVNLCFFKISQYKEAYPWFRPPVEEEVIFDEDLPKSPNVKETYPEHSLLIYSHRVGSERVPVKASKQGWVPLTGDVVPYSTSVWSSVDPLVYSTGGLLRDLSYSGYRFFGSRKHIPEFKDGEEVQSSFHELFRIATSLSHQSVYTHDAFLRSFCPDLFPFRINSPLPNSTVSVGNILFDISYTYDPTFPEVAGGPYKVFLRVYDRRDEMTVLFDNSDNLFHARVSVDITVWGSHEFTVETTLPESFESFPRVTFQVEVS